MCRIVRYWFTCNHGFRLRRSKCGGTKHKRTRSGPMPACKSDSSLSIILSTQCGPCQYLAFEERWSRKLRVAELFLDKLREKGFPGTQEVAVLVEQLKDDFNTAMWDTRTLFPYGHNDRAVRVSLGHFARKLSPLSHEVSPDEISEPSEAPTQEDSGYEFDWDYVASTDPLHPVDTNYAHPLDDVDPSWMLNHLSPEEFEQVGSNVGFDASETCTLWAEELVVFQSTSASWNNDVQDWEPGSIENADTPLLVLGPNYELSKRTTRKGSMAEVSDAQREEAAKRIDMVIEEFWRLVNGEDRQQPNCHDSSDSRISLTNLQISDSPYQSNTPETGLPTPPPTPPQPFSDRSCGSNSPTTSSLSASDLADALATTMHTHPPPTTPSSNNLKHSACSASSSIRTAYGKIRRNISQTKLSNKAKFYQDWLEVARCEIKEIEGLNGRFVQDPQVPLEDGVTNGWWT